VAEQVPVSLIIPSECVLTGDERDIIYNTLAPGEFPCIGCFKASDCPVGATQGFALAQALGADIKPEGIKCPRCGNPAVTDWTIRGKFRVWRCGAKVLGDTLLGEKRAFYCNWEKSELGIPFDTRKR